MTIDRITGTMGSTRRMFRVTTLLLFLFLAPTVVSQEDEEGEQEQQYLYAENAGVVIDYMPSPSTGNPLRPDFLYSKYNGPRMVEFYAPWCPHCQDFRDHFVQFSGQMAEAALSVGVDDFEVYAISCEVHRSLCKNWEIKGFPQMRLFQAGHANYTAKASYWKLNPNDVLKQLGIPAEVGEEPLWVTEEKSKTGKDLHKIDTRSDAARAYKRTQEDVFNDAHLSFHFALRNGIYMTNGPLSMKTRLAFERWLKLLDRALPPRTSLHVLVSTLLEDFENIVKGEEHLLAIAERLPPPQKRWSLGCTHGKKGAGYTCGLWELFHMVTVGVAERNQLSLIDSSAPIGVMDAAETIRDYVENFFGCEVCRMNFVTAFDSCAHDRCTRLDNNATTVDQWRELPLWLFETHNSVNIRLLHERGEREGFTPTSQEEIYRQWPARDDCPQCWRDDGGWVEDNAVAKLKSDYWPEALAALLARQTALFQRPDFFPAAKEELTEIGSTGGDERVLLASDVKVEVGNEDQKENIEEKKVDQNEEGANNNIEAGEEKEEIVNDVTRKYPVIGTEEEDGGVGDKIAEPALPPPPVARKVLLFVVVVLGLIATWYARKLQRKRSGWHKKMDATLSLAWYTTRQGLPRTGPVSHGKEVHHRKLAD